MKPNIPTLFSDALGLPNNAIAYFVYTQLTAHFPDKVLMQTDEHEFDLDEFVRDGHCTREITDGILPLVHTSYRGLRYGLYENITHAWNRVVWQNHTFEIFQLSWHVGNCDRQTSWIVAETIEAARAFRKSIGDWGAEVRGEVLVFQEGYWHKSEELYRSIQNARFDNLILPASLKQEIQEDFAQFFASRATYEKYQIPWKRGVLLIGPPGNGKTHTVKALINSLNIPCLYVKSFRSEYSNDQRNIRQAFERARQTTPCIFVLEDLDSLINDQNRSFFLNELDGFASNTGILLLATTNHPERLDPAILNRPSRFDRKYYFELPAPAERRAYITNWQTTITEAELRLSDEEAEGIVLLTEEYSFAYLKELFLSSLMRWISQERKTAFADVMHEQCTILREQMTAAEPESPPEPSDAENPFTRMFRGFPGMPDFDS